MVFVNWPTDSLYMKHHTTATCNWKSNALGQ